MAFLDFNLKPNLFSLPKWVLLRILSFVYGILFQIWYSPYKKGSKKPYTPQKKTISIGNITVGGTGKTPMIDWLLGYCSKRKLVPAVLTRGYRSEGKDELRILNRQSALKTDRRVFGDEPWMLLQKHPQINIFVSQNRVDSAKKAEQNADLLLLDDGMQHLALNRSLNIVLVDCLAGFGNGQLLPLGPLREPLNNLERADVIIYTRTNLADPQRLQEIVKPFKKESASEFQSKLIPGEIVCSKNNEPISISELKDKSCRLFSGIGNPDSFSALINQLGCHVREHLVFSDHHIYNSKSVNQLKDYLKPDETDFYICTEKDWVKLEPIKDQLPEFWYLRVRLDIEEGFERMLDHHLLQHRD